MVYDGSLIKLNGKNFDCIIHYKIGRKKLMSSDTARCMAGTMKGSLVDRFPKIMLEIEPLDSDNLAELELILDAESFEVEYYNNKFKCTCTGNYYAGDYDEDLLDRKNMIYASFPVNLIPIEGESKHVKNK